MSTTTEIVPQIAVSAGGLQRRVTEADFMPLLAVQSAIKRKEAMKQIISDVLIEGTDYGIQPGSVNEQKVLKKSGAEKLCSVFGLAPRIIKEEIEEDWTGDRHGGEAFFYYKYTIGLYRGDLFLGEAGGSCNSWETKYRWRWVSEAEAKDRPDFAKLPKRGGRRKLFEPDFALDKMETTGRYGKPTEYWQRFKTEIESGCGQRIKKALGKKEFFGYEIEVDDTLVRIPNPNAADVVNTVQKMAYKRALVAPVLVVTNCSDAFTQDLDEDEEPQQHSFTHEAPPDEAPHPADTSNQTAQTTPPKSEPPKQAKGRTSQPAPEPPQPERMPLSEERPVPEELQIMVAAIKRDPKELKRGYDLLWDHAQKLGAPAMTRYEDMNKDFRNRFPRGSNQPLNVYINHILDLWEALGKFERVADASQNPGN